MKSINHPMKEHSSTIAFILLLLFIVAIALVTFCCNSSTTKEYIPQKPFIIIDKGYINTHRIKSHLCRYDYVDAGGRKFTFTDYDNMYHIGDTIK